MTSEQESTMNNGNIVRMLIAACFGSAMIVNMPEASAAGDGMRKTAQANISDLPILGNLPSLEGASAWLNSPPLDAARLRGKVVLVDFWTYSCINCIRTLPHVRAWAEKYRDQGLVVIGVHTPEFGFEKDNANVKKAIARFNINYPVAVDSSYHIWNNFHNDAWPAFYLVDARGQVRARFLGEGNYERTETFIRSLLVETGKRDAVGTLATSQAIGELAAPDLAHLRSGETYVGTDSISPPDAAKNPIPIPPVAEVLKPHLLHLIVVILKFIVDAQFLAMNGPLTFTYFGKKIARIDISKAPNPNIDRAIAAPHSAPTASVFAVHAGRAGS